MMKKVALISGSLRKASYNTALLHHIEETYKHELKMEFVDISAFPLFNEDMEQTPPDCVVIARQQLKASDGIIIATPEYNHSVPGTLKNAIDWFSREGGAMKKKPVLIMGCSTGQVGTARSQSHLRQILNAPGVQALPLPSNEILVAVAQMKFDGNGQLLDDKTAKFIDGRLKRFVKWIDDSAVWRED